DQEYHVVHLSGHGYYDEAGDAGYIVMEDETGAQKHVNARELADALMGWPSVRLLFLAACETGREDPRGSGLARLLAASGIPMVIGMKNPVGDTAATVMAGSFYRHLTMKRSVSHALQLARGEYEKQTRPSLPRPLPPFQWAIPVLFGKNGAMDAVDWEKPLNPTPPGSPGVILYGKVKHLKTGFRGRRKEFRDHLRMLRGGSPPALCITGPGGVGKSTLASKLTDRLHQSGCLVIPMHGEITPDMFIQKTINALISARETEHLEYLKGFTDY
ncbi:MAG: CHAT domain-containing protein, partial [Desulfobacterales bacterium]|nr:CHAT domain-containing protein [Desulfobacterales bacterium]